MRVSLLPQLAQLAQTVVGHDLAAKIPAVVGHEDLARDVDHQVHATVAAIEENVGRVRDESSEHRNALLRQSGDLNLAVCDCEALTHVDEVVLQILEKLPHFLTRQTAVDNRHFHPAQRRRAPHARFDSDHLLRNEVEQTTDLLLNTDRLVALERRRTHFQVDRGTIGLVCSDGDDVSLFDSRKERRVEEQDRVGKGGRVKEDGLLTEIARSGGCPIVNRRFCIGAIGFVLLDATPL